MSDGEDESDDEIGNVEEDAVESDPI